MRTLREIKDVAVRHMEAGTLELGEKVESSKVHSYMDRALFEKEMSQIIYRRPLPFVASEQIKNPGDFFTEEISGVPVVAIRDEQGQAKVFLNVCRHRGAKLATETTGRNCKKFVCPFHGWSYDLSGDLSEIPDSNNCFSATPKKAFKLKELQSYECSGMIWVVLDPSESNLEIEKNFAQLKTDLDELGFTPSFAMPEKSFVANFNWKIGVEAFLEVYHFAHAHSPYLAQLQFPNLSLADVDEANCRIVVPLKKPEAEQSILQWAQVMYFIFPASFLLFYDDHVALISLIPVSVDQTKFRYIPLVPTKEDQMNPKIQQKVDFLEVIIGQDIAILEGIQKGLGSKANSSFTFTRLENLLSEFHQNLNNYHR